MAKIYIKVTPDKVEFNPEPKGADPKLFKEAFRQLGEALLEFSKNLDAPSVLTEPIEIIATVTNGSAETSTKRH